MSGPAFELSPDQQELLEAALNSNQPIATNQRTTQTGSYQNRNQQRASFPFTPSSMSDQTVPGSGHLDFSDDSPYLDFGMDGEMDDSFNFDDTGRMIGDLPEDLSTNDLHDKRKSIGDNDNDDDDEGGGKRREGDDKSAKKPGRKPLTSEPTTKRKAQNRAAQRAFRERKEKHLKDLETKVEDLEKVSESTNHENGLLRAQVERLQIELREYRKRLSWVTNGAGRPQAPTVSQGRNSVSGNDFTFEFPKFGDLPSANYNTSKPDPQNKPSKTSPVNQGYSVSPVQAPAPASRHSISSAGSRTQTSKPGSIVSSPATNIYSTSPVAQPIISKDAHGSVDSLSGLFSPSILEATRNPSGYFPESNPVRNGSDRRSVESFSTVPGLISHSSTNTDSPGSSADSQQHISSMGTSPEPLFNSPGNKQDFSISSVTENNQLSNPFGTQNFNTDPSTASFDWVAQTNGGNFDPVLFGDYRETQDNILSQDFGSFFNDAYPLPDLGSPMHNYGELPTPASDAIPKQDLMKQVEAAKEGEEMVPADKGKMLTCNKIWDRLQSMEKFRNGEIDIDNLCSELRAKAKCSEGGAVVDEKHVNKLLGM